MLETGQPIHMYDYDKKMCIRDSDFADVMMHMTIIRNNKTVYDEDIAMKNQVMTVFNGGNKEYAIRNVYATPSWLKTGDFSCSVKDIDKKYPNITIDYMYLKDNGQVDDIDVYKRQQLDVEERKS